MTDKAPLRIYFVVGEESGDALGAKLIDAFSDMSAYVEPMGLAGEKMQARGVKSLFDTSELSVMGISGVVAQLPGLLRRIKQTAADIIDKEPDVLLLIDSPEFSYRVAQKVRKQLPDTTIIKYVAPTVWAWRPGRAEKITAYIDHILAILPFEPALMKELGGPETTYVGHPLASEVPDVDAKSKKKCGKPVKLVVLPGSRRSEIRKLMPIISSTLDILAERGFEFEAVLPAVRRLEPQIRDEVSKWKTKPEIVVGEEAKASAFHQADVALAASGTVTLELALYKVPMISIYKLDRVMMLLKHLITAWTTALPNLIADYPFVPERLNENAHPQHLARLIERLGKDSHERRSQLEGFGIVAQRLKQEASDYLLAAKKVLEIAESKNS